MKLSKIEQETIILFNEAEDTATVYTHNKAWQNRLDRFCVCDPHVERGKTNGSAKTYKVPKKYICVRKTPFFAEETKLKMANNARERFHQKEKPHTAPDQRQPV